MTDISRRFSVSVTAPEEMRDDYIASVLDTAISRSFHHKTGYPSCDRHQGYANYPTFTVALWFQNSRRHMQLAQEAGRAYRSREEHPDVRLAEWLRSHVGYTMPESQGDDVSGSLLNYVLGTVDWLELARKFLKEEERHGVLHLRS